MADKGNPVGKVASVSGEAFAKAEDGALRQVNVGDPVFEGEVVQAAPGGHVELAFRDGAAYFLRDTEAVTLDGMTFGGRGGDGANVVGKVASIEGQVFAKGADGSVRQLRVGDPVFEGEVIQTPTTNGRVELSFNTGATYFLRDKEAVTLDGMVFGGRVADSRESVLLPGRLGELEDISRAIAEGGSLERLLEETSAGRPAIFGRTDDGHSFVQLLRIAEAIDPLGYQFGNRDLGRVDEILGGSGQVESQASTSPASLPTVSSPTALVTSSVSLTGERRRHGRAVDHLHRDPGRGGAGRGAGDAVQQQHHHDCQRRQHRHGERGGAHGRQLRPGHEHGHGEHHQCHGRQLRDPDGERRGGQHHGGG
jgi:hypothetical protein